MSETKTIPAGRELDALVAEKVFGIDLTVPCDGDLSEDGDSGWACGKCGLTGGWGDEYDDADQHSPEPYCYSTNLPTAMRLVWPWLCKRAAPLSLIHYGSNFRVELACVIVKDGDEFPGDTEAHALCLAALAVAEKEREA